MSAKILDGKRIADDLLHNLKAQVDARMAAGKSRPGLAGEAETTALTPEEKAAWSERFLVKMSEPGPAEEAFFTELRVSGKAVGLDASGKLIAAEAQAEE